MLFKCCKQFFDESNFADHLVTTHGLSGEFSLNTRLMNRVTSEGGKVRTTWEHRVVGKNLTFLQVEMEEEKA